RYDKQSLSDDLVFREAQPLLGGREGVNETQVSPSGGFNNFQGRYIIRHYWTGKVQCKNPTFGRWGGPPEGRAGTPKAAVGLANAARGKVELKKVVRTPMPAFGFPGQRPPAHPGQKAQ